MTTQNNFNEVINLFHCIWRCFDIIFSALPFYEQMPCNYIKRMFLAWIQASAQKCTRTALFWVITQRVPKFRYNLSVPSSCFNLRMRPIDCSETSARNYHYSLRNNPEESSFQRMFLVNMAMWNLVITVHKPHNNYMWYVNTVHNSHSRYSHNYHNRNCHHFCWHYYFNRFSKDRMVGYSNLGKELPDPYNVENFSIRRGPIFSHE
jgi:hypothetical protein